MSKKNTKLYIAYGSNLNVSQMMYRCPDAKYFGTADIKDYELLFKGSRTGSYLTIEPKAGSHVPVGVWEVSAEDEFNLDMYEGYPTFYYKKNMVLDIDTGHGIERRKVFVYIMHETNPLGIPSAHYVETCLEGYRNFGFDSKVLKDAVRKSYDIAKVEPIDVYAQRTRRYCV